MIISALTRPMRSATTPANAPPTAETTSVTVVSSPVWPVSSPKYAEIATMRERQREEVVRVEGVAAEGAGEGAAATGAERPQPSERAFVVWVLTVLRLWPGSCSCAPRRRGDERAAETGWCGFNRSR